MHICDTSSIPFIIGLTNEHFTILKVPVWIHNLYIPQLSSNMESLVSYVELYTKLYVQNCMCKVCNLRENSRTVLEMVKPGCHYLRTLCSHTACKQDQCLQFPPPWMIQWLEKWPYLPIYGKFIFHGFRNRHLNQLESNHWKITSRVHTYLSTGQTIMYTHSCVWHKLF